MPERPRFDSADKLAKDARRKSRDAELARQKRQRELGLAVNTLVVLTGGLTRTDSGQAEYFVEQELSGLDQFEGETNDEFFRRAVGVCRANELSAMEVAERITGQDSRISTALNLGSITPDQKDGQIARLSVIIAEVYTELAESK